MKEKLSSTTCTYFTETSTPLVGSAGNVNVEWVLLTVQTDGVAVVTVAFTTAFVVLTGHCKNNFPTIFEDTILPANIVAPAVVGT